jgi:hypothetical protein
MRSLGFCFLLIIVGCLGLGAWALWLEPASLRTEDHEIHIPNWPAQCDGFRIAVLADLHVGSLHNGLENLRKIVDSTQRAEPDLVLIAGDLVIHGVIGGDFVSPEDSARELGRLSAPAGVFAVLGNHDWWLNAERVRDALESQGIPVLEDRSQEILGGQCKFWLAGVGDFWESPHDIDAALEGVPENDSTVLFTHNPDLFPLVPSRVALTIAGHTHGGQVYIPGLGRLVVPSKFGERFAIGHIVEDGRHLFVSSGIGTSIVPVRFLVPPEVTMLHVRSSDGSGF